MRGYRVLITNNTLARHAGSELYVRDLAQALLTRGHTPIAYSTHLGPVADLLRRATIPVVDDLERVGEPPDVIHGHHHLDTMTALLHFPGVPALYVCHGWLPWQEAPPLAPRIRRYVAVDRVCRDRLVCEHGISPRQVSLILNSVDLKRFRPRPPLPAKPRRALVFSNYAAEFNFLPAVRSACASAGLSCDVTGAAMGNASPSPEDLLGNYDLVFTKARGAQEAMAVGAAVILCDAVGCGPMVTAAEFGRLRQLNFGIRTLDTPVSAEHLAAQIARYDANDAAAVCWRLRAEANIEQAAEAFESLYAEVIREQQAASPADWADELRAAARYFRGLAAHLKQFDQQKEASDHLEAKCARLSQELAEIRQSAVVRLRQRLPRLPFLGFLARTLARCLPG